MHPTHALSKAHCRIARPTNNLNRLVDFYVQGLGFHKIGEFADHDGFDGVMLGHAAAAYHLEFTHRRGEHVHFGDTEECLLVFYVPDQSEWSRVVTHLQASGIAPVESANPYWDRNGMTFSDPDGFRVVIQCARWPPE